MFWNRDIDPLQLPNSDFFRVGDGWGQLGARAMAQCKISSSGYSLSISQPYSSLIGGKNSAVPLILQEMFTWYISRRFGNRRLRRKRLWVRQCAQHSQYLVAVVHTPDGPIRSIDHLLTKSHWHSLVVAEHWAETLRRRSVMGPKSAIIWLKGWHGSSLL